ncbi:MAG: PQQ-like beta-propeller repeat protein [Candidatus Saganbacteria bacterium]|nr:PQQ-like beta-propeller repeat protein [Candidatus Saganbacteria bacterium]
MKLNSVKGATLLSSSELKNRNQWCRAGSGQPPKIAYAFTTKPRQPTSLHIANDLLVVQTLCGLTVLDKKTGEEIWNRFTYNWTSVPALIANGEIFYFEVNRGIHCFDLESGNEHWFHPLPIQYPSPFCFSSPGDKTKNIYSISRRQEVRVEEEATGKTILHFPLREEVEAPRFIGPSTLIYTAARTGTLTRFDINTQEVVWRFSAPSDSLLGRPEKLQIDPPFYGFYSQTRGKAWYVLKDDNPLPDKLIISPKQPKIWGTAGLANEPFEFLLRNGWVKLFPALNGINDVRSSFLMTLRMGIDPLDDTSLAKEISTAYGELIRGNIASQEKKTGISSLALRRNRINADHFETKKFDNIYTVLLDIFSCQRKKRIGTFGLAVDKFRHDLASECNVSRRLAFNTPGREALAAAGLSAKDLETGKLWVDEEFAPDGLSFLLVSTGLKIAAEVYRVLGYEVNLSEQHPRYFWEQFGTQEGKFSTLIIPLAGTPQEIHIAQEEQLAAFGWG